MDNAEDMNFHNFHSIIYVYDEIDIFRTNSRGLILGLIFVILILFSMISFLSLFIFYFLCFLKKHKSYLLHSNITGMSGELGIGA